MAERRRTLRDALDGLASIDREVLALRHFEELSNSETAQVLGLTEAAVSKRYMRALRRMKVVMTALGDTGGSSR